jgi:hypothetical protein
MSGCGKCGGGESSCSNSESKKSSDTLSTRFTWLMKIPSLIFPLLIIFSVSYTVVSSLVNHPQVGKEVKN